MFGDVVLKLIVKIKIHIQPNLTKVNHFKDDFYRYKDCAHY